MKNHTVQCSAAELTCPHVEMRSLQMSAVLALALIDAHVEVRVHQSLGWNVDLVRC